MGMKRASMILVLLMVVSLAMAVVFMRRPSLWSLMPSWLSGGLATAFNVGSQEQAANVEFISAWALCFGVIFIVWVAVMVIWRSKGSWRNQSPPYRDGGRRRHR